uniref:Amidase n=1 Tax=Riptortus pedestris TaxID=329032 RepID=R4WD06_RIPPE|nr:amidase [Riptortus pedestris]
MTTTPAANKRYRKEEKHAFKDCVKQVAILLFLALRIVIDWFIDFVFGFFYKNDDTKKLPGVKENFLLKSASSLAQLIREKQISSEKVVVAYIERIKEVNPSLNAVVDDRYDEAIKEAKDVDKFLAETDLTTEEIKKTKPFLGVPFTSKESTSAKGLAFTFGLVSRKSYIASADAAVVERLKDSGAILIAVTNIPELNLWCETRNNIYGQTQNPYDLTKTVGGSSGGEAAIISACGSPLGIGTDIGGSTRMPAYFCGVFGHKPTTGLITTKGLTFRKGNEGETMVSAGTITRFAEDITPFLKLLLDDNLSLPKLDQKVNLQDVKVAYCLNPQDLRVSPVSNEVIAAILKAVDHLSTISKYHVDKISLDGFRYSLSLWRHEMSKEPGNFAFDLSNQKGDISLKSELPKLIFGKCEFTIPALMRLIDLNVLPPTNKSWAEDKKKQLVQEIQELLGDNGVLLFPSCPTEAPYHYASFLRPYNFAYWAIFNVLKLPVTQVPLGLTKKGLPIGLQVVSNHYNDHLCIAIAEELQRVFGGWTPPFTD